MIVSLAIGLKKGKRYIRQSSNSPRSTLSVLCLDRLRIGPKATCPITNDYVTPPQQNLCIKK